MFHYEWSTQTINVPGATKIYRKNKKKKNKEWKRSKNTSDTSAFDKAYSDHDALNTKLYNEYVDKMKSKLKDDPASFWNYVNSLKNNNNNPVTMRLENISTSDTSAQANLFAEFVKTSFAPSCTTNQPITLQNNSDTILTLSGIFVFEQLLKVNTKKGTGPDQWTLTTI